MGGCKTGIIFDSDSISSTLSEPNKIAQILQLISIWDQFRYYGATAIKSAVDEVNGQPGKDQIMFVNPGFEDQNSLFAPKSLLFGPKGGSIVDVLNPSFIPGINTLNLQIQLQITERKYVKKK